MSSDRPLVFLTPDASVSSIAQQLASHQTDFFMASGGLQRGFLDGRSQEELQLERLKSFAQQGLLEAVVTGVTAVSDKGVRLGKGQGYFDIEWALLCSLGLANSTTDIIAVAHDCQVFSSVLPTSEHDALVDLIVTPTRIIRTGAKKRVGKVDWNSLDPSLAASPFFQELRQTQSAQG
eukprot:gb/GFBE01022519.1/.p1 GENE.gb/GFBE01022519.1/~~gb/GFBE01022519.1/.p1  ORF type:complete len:178 (+),score=45.41 gb/GFBE01022519.1/:1-534(+)